MVLSLFCKSGRKYSEILVVILLIGLIVNEHESLETVGTQQAARPDLGLIIISLKRR